MTASANEEDGKILAVFEKIAKDSNKSLNEHFYPDVSEFQTQLKNLYEEGNIANKPHLLPAYNKLTRNLEEIAKLTASSSSIRETTNSQHVQTFQYGDQTEIKKTEQELNQRQQSSKSVARKNRKK